MAVDDAARTHHNIAHSSSLKRRRPFIVSPRADALFHRLRHGGIVSLRKSRRGARAREHTHHARNITHICTYTYARIHCSSGEFRRALDWVPASRVVARYYTLVRWTCTFFELAHRVENIIGTTRIESRLFEFLHFCVEKKKKNGRA